MNRVAPFTAFAAAALAAAPLSAARAQYPEPLAPPVSDYAGRTDEAYLWRDVPSGERVPIERASFDRDGYRLIDDRGQAIAVPFDGNNLYVMRFGRTSGAMYFVNDGGVPTLYVSSGDYLDNRMVSGARWYPFPRNYEYDRPVYLGIAPTWNDYCAMGWYPGMVYYGGYWGYRPWSYGVTFRPTAGLYISIGGHSWNRWDEYYGYYRYTPRERVVIVDSPRYYRSTTIIHSDGGYRRDRDYRGGSDRGDYRGGYSRGGAERYEPQKDRYVRGGTISSGSSSRDDRYSRSDSGRPSYSPSRPDSSGRDSARPGYSRDSSAGSGSSGSARPGYSRDSSRSDSRDSAGSARTGSGGADRRGGGSSDTHRAPDRGSSGGSRGSSRDREAGKH